MSSDLQIELERLKGEVVHLRRKVEHGRLIVLLLGTLVLLTALSGFRPQEEEVRARRFIVVDEAGTPRAVLSSSQDQAGLILLTPSETPTAMLLASSSGSQFTLQHPGSQRQVVVTADRDIAQLAQRDGYGRMRLSLTTSDSEGGSALRLQDAGGTVRAAVGFWQSTGPGVSVMNERGQVQRALMP